MSNKNNLNHHLSFLMKSTLALSIATVGLAGKSGLKLNSFSSHIRLHDTTVKAAGLPDLSDVYYDEASSQFRSGGAWTPIESNQYATTFVNNVTMDGGIAVASSNTSAVVLINIGDETASGGSFTFGIQPSTVISSGSVQEVTLQGHRYYGFSIGPNEVQAGAQKASKVGDLTFFNITGVPHVSTVGLPIKAPTESTTATMTLPATSFTENGQLASSAVIGKAVNITDDAGKTLGSITLKKEWISVSGDAKKAGSYSYTLNSAGIQAVKDLLADKGDYDFKTPGAATITIKPKAAAKASLTVKYVDQKTGKTVKTDTSITGTVGTTGSYQVKIPSGYKLATGQAKTLKYKLTADNSDDLTVKVVKQDSTSSSSNSSKSSSSKGSSSKAPSPGSKSSSSKGHGSHSSGSKNNGTSNTNNAGSQNQTVSMGSATIVLVDDDTGRIITRRVYSGPVGSTMQVNFQDRITDLLRRGYNLVGSDLNGYHTVRFGANSPLYQLHFRKAGLPPLQSAIARASDDAQDDKDKDKDKDKKKKSSQKDKKKKKHSKKKTAKKDPKKSAPKEKKAKPDIDIEKLTNRTILRQAFEIQDSGAEQRGIIQRNQEPIIYDTSLKNFLDGLGGNGGNGMDESGLAEYFLALAGRVNLTR